MRRREWFKYTVALTLIGCGPGERKNTKEEVERRLADGREHSRLYREKVLAAFPFQWIEVKGGEALAAWEDLRASAGVSPVVVGEEAEFHRIVDQCCGTSPVVSRTPAELLALASRIKYPEEFVAKVAAEEEEAHAELVAELKKDPNMPLPSVIVLKRDGRHRELSRKEVVANFLQEPREPELGEWPKETPPETPPDLGLSVAYRVNTPHEKVYIVLVPTSDSTEIPAHLHWGGWNACPSPEYHVAALRSWRERYGAELVGLSSDVMNLRIAQAPQTREDALALAREQYAYCNDLIDQGVGTLSALAADRMRNRWWDFWWD